MDIEDKMVDILKGFTKQKFNGITITEVVRQYGRGLGSRRADIVIIKEDGAPFLLVEAKKKYEVRGFKAERRFIVTSDEVLGQVFSYAAILKRNGIYVPFVATVNENQIAVFKVPEDIDKHVDWGAIEGREYGKVLPRDYIYEVLRVKYLILHTRISFARDFFANILDTITGVYAKKYKIEEKKQGLHRVLIEDLRGFVDFLAPFIAGAIAPNNTYRGDIARLVEGYARSRGYWPEPIQLAREMAYALVNKIVFYKVLERHYNFDRGLRPFYGRGEVKSVNEYLRKLNEFFEYAVQRTNGFEAIFKAGIYDNIDIVEDVEVLKALDWFIDLIDNYRIEDFGDIMGHVYEDLIPAEKRHILGEFYTPKPIAELIVKWAIRSPGDKVLDPGCGSGTFLVETYKRLAELKKFNMGRVPSDTHEEILQQLFGIDINEFSAHLAAMNLAMRNPRAPSGGFNIIVADFFTVVPGMRTLAPYMIRTPSGETHRVIEMVGEFDCVVGNPPYTRWTEMPDSIRTNIKARLGRTIQKYNVLGGFSGGNMYMLWIMHATGFLKQNGRLGMIIPNNWLQTDYGIEFGKFLLDNYKVKALIDFSQKLFKVPLVATLVILLEKEERKEVRENNDVVFIYVDKEISINELLDAIDNPGKYSDKLYVKTLKQRDLPRDRKWIEVLFGLGSMLRLLHSRGVITRIKHLFEISRGNFYWSFTRRIGGLGANEFFYLTDDDVQRWRLPSKYLYPLLASPRYSRYFTFTEDDWSKIRKKWVFTCREPRQALPESVRRYIEWGERDCRTRKNGKICSQTLACVERRRSREFIDWYDFGGILEAPIYATYGARCWMRFILSKFKCALNDTIIALIPKQGVKLDEVELKALLAYLNSSLTQFQIETKGRNTGGGMIILDIKPLSDFLVLDVKKLPRSTVVKLAKLFDKLEAEARRLGGADKIENVFGSELARELTGKEVKPGIEGLFNTVIKEIDYEVARILGIGDLLISFIRSSVLTMIRRRLGSADETESLAIRGSEETIEAPTRLGTESPVKPRMKRGSSSPLLDEWLKP